MVVAAHPDDEAFGCGGVIARHAANGDSVHVIFMTDGVGARGAGNAESERRRAAASNALSVLQAQSCCFLDFPDNQMDTVPMLEIVRQIEQQVSELKPSVVYTHSPADLNIDHQITHSAVFTACRPLPGSYVDEIYGFEVMSSTDWSSSARPTFSPTLFIDIADFLSQKLNALEAYAEELRAPPHSRSLEHQRALAVHRGHSSGFEAAEAFETYRIRK